MRIIRPLLLTLAIALIPAPLALGGERRGHNLPPPVDYSASRAAQQSLAEARQRSTAADAALITAVATLKKEFEAGPEWQAALADLRQATADHEKARQPLVQKLRESAPYKAAEADRKKLTDELEQLRSTPGASQQLTEAATRLMQANSVLTRLEADAISSDPAVAEARQRMVDASARLAALRKQFDDSIKGSAVWQRAKSEQDAAQRAIASAQQELRDAQVKEGELEQRRQQQVAEIEDREDAERRRLREREREEDRRRANRTRSNPLLRIPR
jgi:hypothetical protein